jgi:hypothetical protein
MARQVLSRNDAALVGAMGPPGPALAALRQAWTEVIAEDTARDPLLAEAWEGYLRFSAAYGDWQARAYAD